MDVSAVGGVNYSMSYAVAQKIRDDDSANLQSGVADLEEDVRRLFNGGHIVDQQALSLATNQLVVERDRATHLHQDYFERVFDADRPNVLEYSASCFGEIVARYAGTRYSFMNCNFGIYGFYTDEEIDFKLRDLSAQYDAVMEKFTTAVGASFGFGKELGDIIGEDYAMFGASIKRYIDSGNMIAYTEHECADGSFDNMPEYTDFYKWSGSLSTARFSLDELSALYTVRRAQLTDLFAPAADTGERFNLERSFGKLRPHVSDTSHDDILLGALDVIERTFSKTHYDAAFRSLARSNGFKAADDPVTIMLSKQKKMTKKKAEDKKADSEKATAAPAIRPIDNGQERYKQYIREARLTTTILASAKAKTSS